MQFVSSLHQACNSYYEILVHIPAWIARFPQTQQFCSGLLNFGPSAHSWPSITAPLAHHPCVTYSEHVKPLPPLAPLKPLYQFGVSAQIILVSTRRINQNDNTVYSVGFVRTRITIKRTGFFLSSRHVYSNSWRANIGNSQSKTLGCGGDRSIRRHSIRRVQFVAIYSSRGQFVARQLVARRFVATRDCYTRRRERDRIVIKLRNLTEVVIKSIADLRASKRNLVYSVNRQDFHEKNAQGI